MRFSYRLLATGSTLFLLMLWALTAAIKQNNTGNQSVKPVAVASQKPELASSVNISLPFETVAPKKTPKSDNDLFAYLEPSARPQDILLLLMLRGSRDNKDLARLRSLLNHTSERAIVLYLIAQFKVDGEYAATSQELKALKTADPDNAVVDDLLAQRAYHNGNAEQALYHLQQGGEATANNAYQVKYLDLIGEAYLDRNGYLTAEDFAAIIGISAAYPLPHLGFLTRICRDNANQTAWIEACGARAGTLFDYGETALDRAIGARLVTEYLPGDTARFSDYSEQTQATLMALSLELEQKLNSSGAMIDSQTWRNYIALYAEQGELAAMRYLVNLFH